jgi:hypothetical protein
MDLVDSLCVINEGSMICGVTHKSFDPQVRRAISKEEQACYCAENSTSVMGLPKCCMGYSALE